MEHYNREFPTQSKYYKCRRCKTHLAADEEVANSFLVSKTLVIKQVVNIAHNVLDTRDSTLRLGAVAAITAYCSGCHNPIGWKIIQCLDTVHFARPGNYVIRLDKVLYWDGVQEVDEMALHYDDHSDG